MRRHPDGEPRDLDPFQKLLDVLEQLLQLPGGDLKATLSRVSDVIARSSGADKVDAFLYDESRDSLVAVGTSTQALSQLQRDLGLDVLQLSNGGQTVSVYQTGRTYLSGRVGEDRDELRGIREALKGFMEAVARWVGIVTRRAELAAEATPGGCASASRT